MSTNISSANHYTDKKIMEEKHIAMGAILTGLRGEGGNIVNTFLRMYGTHTRHSYQC